MMDRLTNPLSSLNTSSLGSFSSTQLSCITAVCVYACIYIRSDNILHNSLQNNHRVVVREDTVLCVTLGRRQHRSSVSPPTLKPCTAPQPTALYVTPLSLKPKALHNLKHTVAFVQSAESKTCSAS